jgi:hypothetical protein
MLTELHNEMLEALAQPAPVQEPTYVYTCNGCGALYTNDDVSCDCQTPPIMQFDRHILVSVPTPPTQPAPVQEPVAWMEMVAANLVRERINKHKARELAEHFYTTPPQRTWVGLTDEEIQECYAEAYKIAQGRRLEIAFARVTEAKLKEKNEENT